MSSNSQPRPEHFSYLPEIFSLVLLEPKQSFNQSKEKYLSTIPICTTSVEKNLEQKCQP